MKTAELKCFCQKDEDKNIMRIKPLILICGLAAERALKNFAIGRRNWLFAKSIRGAQASATVYSITETAMLNGLKPYHYLTYVLEKMKDLGPFPEKEAMQGLLPWSASLPADCHSKLKK